VTKVGQVNIVMKKLVNVIVLITDFAKMGSATAIPDSLERSASSLNVPISAIIMEYVTRTDDVIASLVIKETRALNYICCMAK
jgi:hypothetical protein